MVEVVVHWDRLLVTFLILWAVTGYTFVHLAVLAWTSVSGRLRRWRQGPPPQHPSVDLTLAFVVPVYNEAKTIRPTLESLLAQTRKAAQVIVVDDGSTDGTADVVEAFTSRGVTLVRMERNSGKAKAIEAGLALVQTDLVAFIDADSIAHPEYAASIMDSFRDPEVAAAAGALESIPHTWVTASRQIEYMLTLGIDREAQSRMGALFVLPGASATYRTAVLRELGFEHDTIGEDLDLTFRMHKAGRKMVLNRKARVYTSDPPTLRAYATQLRRWYTDVWLVACKHRDILGKGTFGKVELPLAMVNTVLACILGLVLPVWLLFRDPAGLLEMILWTTALDLGLVLVAYAVYGRGDVWWNLVSRYPTRAISRFTYLRCMVEVLLGRHDRRWNKLERRTIDHQLAAMR